MSEWTDVFLGVIAVSTLVTAIFHLGLLLAAGRLVLRLTRLTERVEREITPIVGHLDSIGRDAARMASVAATQVERVDGLFSDFAARVEETMETVQHAAGRPAREGAAILAGFKAVFSTLRDARRARARSRGEDEDALFI